MDEKKSNETGEELSDEQLEGAAGGFFAPAPRPDIPTGGGGTKPAEGEPCKQ